MKILLASNGKFSIEEGYKLLGIPTDQIHIGYITTASKGAKNLDYLERHRQEMVQAGYFYEEFDIEGKSKEDILNFFTDKTVIYVEGGNTFYLLKAIRESGFDEVLKNLLDRGLVYIGVSAGAYIMCPNIEVATWRTGVERRFGVEDLTGLNYVPYVLKAHYTDDMQKDVKEKTRNLKYPLRILRDGQGIYIEDGKERFVGEGEEVKLELTKEINEIRNTKIF
ncbi:MAG: Type 1 glutamine amidotransferase-like domain-containing protein [Patescibacteria group bacterium]